MDKGNPPRMEKVAAILVITLAVIAVVVTAVLGGWYGLTLLALAAVAVGGLAAYLKLKNKWARVAGLVLFALGLFWLCTLPIIMWPKPLGR